MRRPTPPCPPTGWQPCRASSSRSSSARRAAVPPEARRPAARRDRGRVRVLERRAGRRLPGARAHPARPRHRGQRPGDGLRQPRRRVGNRRRLHARPRDGRERRLRGLPRERPGRGRGRGHPHHRAARRPRATGSRRSTRAAPPSSIASSAHYRDMCDTEFTIEQGKLWMLQTRVGKRTGPAALRMAVEMVDDAGDLGISQAEAVGAHHRRPPRLAAAPAVRDVAASGSSREVLARRPARRSGGATSRPREASTRRPGGEHVLLVRPETSPEDVRGMLASAGRPDARVAGSSPTPRSSPGVGASPRSSVPRPSSCRAGTRASRASVIEAGDMALDRRRDRRDHPRRGRDHWRRLSSAGARRRSSTGPMRSGRADLPSGRTRTPAADAANARGSAQRGSGCAGPSTCSSVRTACRSSGRMILASSDDAEAAALEELRVAQRADFFEILEAMDGLPVTVRLLDPPLHEFLPSTEELRGEGGSDRTLDRRAGDARGRPVLAAR